MAFSFRSRENTGRANTKRRRFRAASSISPVGDHRVLFSPPPGGFSRRSHLELQSRREKETQHRLSTVVENVIPRLPREIGGNSLSRFTVSCFFFSLLFSFLAVAFFFFIFETFRTAPGIKVPYLVLIFIKAISKITKF